MVVAIYSLVRQKERLRGRRRKKRKEEGEEARCRRKAGRKAGTTATPMTGEDVSIGRARSGVSHARNKKKWTVVWGSTPQEEQRGLVISPILSR